MTEESSIAASDDSIAPADLKVKLAEQRLVVTWKDGSQTVFEMGWLRKVCPCATCRTAREEQAQRPTSLTILKHDPAKIRAVGAKLVGHYAIQFEWSDGHNTSIYDFRTLRAMSPESVSER